MAGRPGSTARISCTRRAPLITGIRMSVIRASNFVLRAASIASAPPVTTVTSAPSSSRISATFSAKALLSSTIRYRRIRLCLRHAHDESRAVSPRLVGDASPVPLDDPLHEREAEPDPFLLGGDEGLEQPAPRGIVDPLAAVLDAHRHEAILELALDPHPARLAGGMRGVVEQVHEDLPELVRVSVDLGQIGERLEAEAQVELARRHLHDVAQAQPLGGERPVPDHVEEVLDDAVRDPELLADALDVLLRARVLADPALEDVERALHHPERIAQLVADGADELTERREPFRARLLREEVLPVGVEHDGELEIEDLADRDPRLAQLLGILEIGVVDDGVELLAEHVHRAEHVVLGQGDGDVLAPDAGANLVVGLVPGTAEQLGHPPDQRVTQVTDLALSAFQRLACAFVREDAVIEEDRDPLEMRLGDGEETAEGFGVDGVEADVAFQLRENRLPHLMQQATAAEEMRARASLAGEKSGLRKSCGGAQRRSLWRAQALRERRMCVPPPFPARQRHVGCC